MQKSVHTKEYKALRAELRAVREAAGFSQRDLATKLGVPHSWVAKVEAGERRIDVVELIWLASACGEDASRIVSHLSAFAGRKNSSQRSAGRRSR
jgi:transcriptional regulator with XRE-family HTH domain